MDWLQAAMSALGSLNSLTGGNKKGNAINDLTQALQPVVQGQSSTDSLLDFVQQGGSAEKQKWLQDIFKSWHGGSNGL
jgi:hypothetical protein